MSQKLCSRHFVLMFCGTASLILILACSETQSRISNADIPNEKEEKIVSQKQIPSIHSHIDKKKH